MSVADKITRLITARNNIRTALTAKGITAASGHGFEDFAEDISDITNGGSGGNTSTSGLNIKIINHINPETGLWERPAEWPDITSLANNIDYENNEQCAYFTYDLSKFAKPWIGLYVRNPSSSSTWYLDRGHISNGTFVVDESFSNSSGTAFRQTLDISNGEIQLWRLTSDAHITKYGFTTNTTTSASSFINSYQPCVERSGNLPWITDISSSNSTSPSSYSNAGRWLEQDSLALGNNSHITNLSNAWNSCCSLQYLDLSHWDTANWAITKLDTVWYNCYSLQSLDLSNWDTTNWVVNSLSSTWANCFSLKSLNINNWDTTNWAVTTLTSTWSNCYNLKSLNINNWDTTNWAVTTLGSTWYNCYNLQSLDLSNWDTTNWAVTSLTSTWYYCYSLQALNINAWDTTNWIIANLGSTWQYCCSLQSLDLSNWDTTNWEVTTLGSTWQYCYSLQSLNLNTWNTTNWVVAAFGSTWSNCFSLQSLDLSNWDTTNWAVTNFSNTWASCYNLRSLKGPEQWTWVTSKTFSVLPTNAQFLSEFNGLPYSVNHTYSNLISLTITSLVNILTGLPTVTASRTITLSSTNKLKLTNEQIAIATQKGWTVA